MPARTPARTAALRPVRDVRASARRTPPSGGADRPERLRGRRRPRMPKPQRVEKLWPVDLPDGSEELEAVAELMAALGPAERAQLAEMMRDDVYGAMAQGLAGADPDELRERLGREVYEDPEAWDEQEFEGRMWAALRAQLEPEEAEVLDQFFGEDWSAAGEMETYEFESKLAQLSDDDKRALLSVMGKMGQLSSFVEAAEATSLDAQADFQQFIREQQREQQREEQRRSDGEGEEDSGDGGGGGAWEGGPYPGASPAVSRVLEVLQGGETILVDADEEEARRQRMQEEAAAAAEKERRRRWGLAGDGGGGGSGGEGAGRRWGEWGPRAGGAGREEAAEDMDSRLDSAMRHSRAMAAGVQDWGPPPSRHFQVLKTIHARLAELEAMDHERLQEAHGMSPDDYVAAFEYLNEQLAALLDSIDDITDTATRSALLYMDTVMADPTTGGLEVTKGGLEAMGSFLAAAENLEALKWWARAFGANHKQLNVPRVVEAAGLDGDDWFVRRSDRGAAAEAAAAAGPSGGAVLRPYVDSQRVEWLAALDGDNLRFMADIEEQQYSQDVLIKWSLHPAIGPRLASGQWYEEARLPGVLQELFREAQQPWEGADYEWVAGGDAAGAAAARRRR